MIPEALELTMDPNTPKLYDLTLKIDGKKVPMIPFILNTCGHIFFASIQDLEIVKENLNEKLFTCEINPSVAPESILKLRVGDENIKLKPFIQNMIWKTMVGFLSTLKKIPENLILLPIEISIKKIV